MAWADRMCDHLTHLVPFDARGSSSSGAGPAAADRIDHAAGRNRRSDKPDPLNRSRVENHNRAEDIEPRGYFPEASADPTEARNRRIINC
jgi:hypothetical protein